MKRSFASLPTDAGVGGGGKVGEIGGAQERESKKGVVLPKIEELNAQTVGLPVIKV